MRKIKWVSLALSLALLSGCTATPIPFEEMTIAERIESATTFSAIEQCLEDSEEKNSNYTDEEKIALFEQIKTYLFTEGNINGSYYYYQKFIAGTLGWYDYGREVSDSVVIYAVSSDEIYVVPTARCPENMEALSTYPTYSQYKYKASIRYNSSEGIYLGTTFKGGGFYANFYLQRSSGGKTLDLGCYVYSTGISEVHVNGVFAHQTPEAGYEIPKSRTYYSDEQTATSEANKYIEDYEAKKAAEEALSKSDPKVGMTKSQVEKSAWGKPNKKNVSEYSWGTKEQWVYDSEGYVYFENGVVTSVSKKG